MTKLELMYRTEDCCHKSITKDDISNNIKSNFEEISIVEVYDYNDFLDKRLINFKIQSYLKESNLLNIKTSEALKILLPLIIIDGNIVTEGIYCDFVRKMNI
ncbi:hypothetical protein RW115_12570 [Macrococcus capreoli]